MFWSYSLAAGLVFQGASAAFSTRTPPMGYNPYNARGCTTDEASVTEDILNFSRLGFRDLGYDIFGMDCGWQATSRPANKSITYDQSAFPNGILPLSKLAKSKRFTFGMYTDQGVYSCDTRVFTRTGSLGFERFDALQFKQWGAEYVKVDNCFIDGINNAPKDPRSDFVDRMGAMSKELKAVGIPGMLTCQWGVPYINGSTLEGPAEWTPGISTSFRVSDDIAQGWNNVERIFNQAINVNIRGLNGPGRWSDMDLLEVGNGGMTVTEQATHFAIWAMFKSSLMVSTPLATMSDDTKAILQNKRLIAVNQDTLGKPVTLVQRYSLDHDVYAGPLAHKNLAILLVDRSNQARTLSIDFAALNVTSATVTNLWTGEVIKNAKGYSANVDAHGSLALKLEYVKLNTATTSPMLQYYDAADGKLSGGAVVAPCAACVSGKKVGYLGRGNDNSVTFSFTTSAATQDLRFDYINAEIGYLNTADLNYRTASIIVNGGTPITVEFPLSGYDWSQDVYKDFLVRVTGLNVNGQVNTITITNSNGYAPDISRIGVVV